MYGKKGREKVRQGRERQEKSCMEEGGERKRKNKMTALEEEPEAKDGGKGEVQGAAQPDRPSWSLHDIGAPASDSTCLPPGVTLCPGIPGHLSPQSSLPSQLPSVVVPTHRPQYYGA